MSRHGDEIYDILSRYKAVLIDQTQIACVQTGLDVRIKGTAKWVPWHDMSAKEKKENVGAQEEGGFFRVGIQIKGIKYA
jgi:hypothetical protein